MRISLWISVFGLALATLPASPVQAQYWDGPDGAIYEYAEVLRADPIIRSVERPVYRDECRDVPVIYREPPRYVRRSGPRAPAVLGGIIGGVVGNQFGHGGGRDAATMAGAMLGHAMVRDAQDYGGHYEGGREFTRYERHCTPRTDYRRDEQITGYDVTYRYQGRVYHTVTDYPPGPSIRVRIDVSPVP